MDERTVIKARLSQVRKDLIEAVGRLADDTLPWAPTPGMKTISALLVEILSYEKQDVALLRKESIPDDDAVIQWIGNLASVQVIEQKLAEVRNDTLSYIDTLSDADLQADAGVPPEWQECLGLPWVSRAEVFRSIAQHEAYHTGQLVTYLWSRGDDPYKW